MPLRALVFISHHRTYRFALLQQQFGERAPYPANAARRAGDQNGIRHVLSPCVHLNRKSDLLNASVNQQPLIGIKVRNG